MSLPWDNQPQRPAQMPPPPVQPQYQQPYQPQPQQYQPPVQTPYNPNTPMVATNTQTGQQVKLDMGSVIQQAVNDALRENSRHAASNATQAMQRKAKPKERDAFGLDGDETVEEAFQSGAVTTMTFVRGISLDIGVSLIAAFATIADGDNFSAFDAEMWKTVIPALVMKTVVQTGISFAMKAKYK